MAYGPHYVVRWLLQNTEGPDQSITWQRYEYGRYFADFHTGTDHQLRVAVGSTLRPPRIDIKFTSPGRSTGSIYEPLRALFSSKYESEDDAQLSKDMKRLIAVISDQHAKKQLWEMENEEECQQSMFRMLIDGDK